MSASASVLRPAPSVAGAVAPAIADDHRLIDTAPAYLEQQQAGEGILNSERYVR